MWGEWIEISLPGAVGHWMASLPVWGEWIEIYQVLCRNLFVDGSLPVWGEWIEI